MNVVERVGFEPTRDDLRRVGLANRCLEAPRPSLRKSSAAQAHNRCAPMCPKSGSESLAGPGLWDPALRDFASIVAGEVGFEPTVSWLTARRSAALLLAKRKWCTEQVSTLRPPALQASALPTELSVHRNVWRHGWESNPRLLARQASTLASELPRQLIRLDQAPGFEPGLSHSKCDVLPARRRLSKMVGAEGIEPSPSG